MLIFSTGDNKCHYKLSFNFNILRKTILINFHVKYIDSIITRKEDIENIKELDLFFSVYLILTSSIFFIYMHYKI